MTNARAFTSLLVPLQTSALNYKAQANLRLTNLRE